MPTRKQFKKSLREALNHLYDPPYLGESPLAAWLGLAGADSAARLQQALLEAIASLPGSPQGASADEAARAYPLLRDRYVEQFSQKEVADQLGVSVRHFRREQDRALTALGGRLLERFDLRLDA